MAKSKAKKGTVKTLFRAAVLQTKLHLPTGIMLNDSEAAIVIDTWKEEKQAILARQGTLIDVSEQIKRRMDKLPSEILSAAKQVREAKTKFKQSKSPIAKRKWASRLIITTRYHATLRSSSQSLKATTSRVKDALEDSKIVHAMLTNRIEDAQIYRNLNSGLKLVGKALIDARSQHVMPEVEYQNLEFTMEAIEKELHGSQETLLIEAEAIAKGK